MPYCVNCGVHLNDHARTCPLCQTKVILPESQDHIRLSGAQPLMIEQVREEFDRNLWIKLMSITLIAPATISLLVNWVLQRTLSWSLYVALSLTFVWTWAVSPFLFKQHRLSKWVPVGMLTLLGFLFALERISFTQGWFLTIGLPITVSFFLIMEVLGYLIDHKLIRELQIPSAIIVSIGIFCIVINASISLYNLQHILLDWSLIVLTTCISFGLIGLVLQQRPWIVEEIKHWFRL